GLLLRGKAVRKDSAVHVSLSSDSPVKQPGTEVVPSPGEPGGVEATSFRLSSEAVLPRKVRSFAGAPSRRHADGAPCPRYIGFDSVECQHIWPKNIAFRVCSNDLMLSVRISTLASCYGARWLEILRTGNSLIQCGFGSEIRIPGWRQV